MVKVEFTGKSSQERNLCLLLEGKVLGARSKLAQDEMDFPVTSTGSWQLLKEGAGPETLFRWCLGQKLPFLDNFAET